MNAAVMRFDSIALSHNPKELTVRRRRGVYSEALISGEHSNAAVLDEGGSISGRAELYGLRCRSDYARLRALCEDGRAAVLALPFFGAFYAVLTSLTLAAEPKKDYIAVDFVFTAVAQRSPKAIGEKPFTTVQEGESLWDVAYRTGCDINELVRLNTHIRHIESPAEGEVVCLSDMPQNANLF